MKPFIVYIIIIAFISLLFLPCFTAEEPATAVESSFGLDIVFKDIDEFEIQYTQVLLGADAAQIRTAIDQNETWGNNNGHVETNEVAALEEFLNSVTSLPDTIILSIGKNSYDLNISYEVTITGAEQSIVSQSELTIYYIIIGEIFVERNTRYFYINLTVADDAVMDFFYLKLPYDLPMEVSELQPSYIQLFASSRHINISKEMAPGAGTPLYSGITIKAKNTLYVPPEPPVDDDVIIDDDDDDDDTDDNTTIKTVIVVGLIIVMAIALLMVYKRSNRPRDKNGKDEE